jgi:Peptidase family M23
MRAQDDDPPSSRVQGPQSSPPTKPKPRLIFPVVGPVTYTNDFGAPRPQGPHQGNDLIAPKRSLAVAVEDGTVKLRSGGTAGCYLYLYGKSKTTYLYIHLNNDLTKGNDNRGKCVPGVAFAPGLKSGAKVRAGEPVGYVGDSGDANGVASHLHFEVHPKGGAAVSPYPFLNRAIRLLFAADRGKTVSLALTGTIVKTTAERLELKVSSLRAYPGGYPFSGVNRTLVLTLDASAYVERAGKTAAQTDSILPLSTLKRGVTVKLWTVPAPSTLQAQMGKDGALAVNRVQIS